MNPDEPQNPAVVPDANQPIQPPVQSMDFVQPPPETPAPVEQPIQMPPYAPVQPPVVSETAAPTNFAAPVMPASAAPAAHKTDTLGIVSIVLGFLGVFPVGLILGLVGASKAKKAGRPAILSRIGWILNLVSALVVGAVLTMIVMSIFQVAQAEARDLERVNNMGVVEAKLEAYFTDNFGYPSDINDLDIADNIALVGPNGTIIKVNKVAADEDEAKATANPTSSTEYTYTPYGKPTCLTTCDGYVLKSLIEVPATGLSNPLVKLGLENL